MSNFAKDLLQMLYWDVFTLRELRYIFLIQNEPVFQEVVAQLIVSGKVELRVLNGEPILSHV